MKKHPYKLIFSLTALCLLHHLPTYGKVDSQNKDDAEKEKKKQVALEKRLAEEKEVKSQFDYTFNDIDTCIVTISCSGEHGRSSGSGFIANMEGRTYLFTNQHVIYGRR